MPTQQQLEDSRRLVQAMKLGVARRVSGGEAVAPSELAQIAQLEATLESEERAVRLADLTRETRRRR